MVGLGPGAETTAAGLAAVDSAVAAVGGEGPAAYALDDREDGFWEVEVLGQGGARTRSAEGQLEDVELFVDPATGTVDG